MPAEDARAAVPPTMLRRACAGVVAVAAEAAVPVDDADADVGDCVRVPRRVVICLQPAQIGPVRGKSRGAESAPPIYVYVYIDIHN